MERRGPEIRSFFNELEGNYLVVAKSNAIKVANLYLYPLPSSKPIIYQCATIHRSTTQLSNLRCIVVSHLNDVVYTAQMFAKLVLSSERNFLAITSVNMTLEFRLESWDLMPRIIMAIKVIQTAASDWATRHQAHETGTLVWTWVVWENRLVPER